MLFSTQPRLTTFTILLSLTNAMFSPANYNADANRPYGDVHYQGNRLVRSTTLTTETATGDQHRYPWVVHEGRMYTLTPAAVVRGTPINHSNQCSIDKLRRYRGGSGFGQVAPEGSNAVTHCYTLLNALTHPGRRSFTRGGHFTRGAWNIDPINTIVGHPNDLYWHNAVRLDSEEVTRGGPVTWRRICFQAPLFGNQGAIGTNRGNGTSETYGSVSFRFPRQVGELFLQHHPGALDHYLRKAMAESVRSDHSMDITVDVRDLPAVGPAVAPEAETYWPTMDPSDPLSYVSSRVFRENAGRDITHANHQAFLHHLIVLGGQSANFWQNNSIKEIADNGGRIISIWRLSKKFNQLQRIAQELVKVGDAGAAVKLVQINGVLTAFRNHLTALAGDNDLAWNSNSVLGFLGIHGVTEDVVIQAIDRAGGWNLADLYAHCTKVPLASPIPLNVREEIIAMS